MSRDGDDASDHRAIGIDPTLADATRLHPNRVARTDVPAPAPVADVPVAGDLVAGAYRIVRHLGTGAMGTVLLALDENLERDVAIKFVELADDERRDELVALFRGEARAMARVRHPNVVQIYTLGVHAGLPYFVMEFVPGQSLDAAEPRSHDEAVSVLEQICQGLDAIHCAGAVHNDLKPGNILIGPGCRVFVADFGLATATDRPLPPRVAGTPAYMAPEVARGEPIDAELASRCDIYGLGVLAFELLAGRRPFLAKGVHGQLQQHAYDPPPRATTVNPALPAGFDDFFARLLAKDPRERMPSAAQMRRELLALQSASPSAPLHFIVVDDDAGTLRGVAEVLDDEFPGSEIRTFGDGVSALEAARQRPPDVLITDLHMPRQGGFELTANLRRDSRTQRVPIIVMTGQGGASDWQELLRLGADRFLVKPLLVESLTSAIRAVVSRPRA